jgi:hypothetical protein
MPCDGICVILLAQTVAFCILSNGLIKLLLDMLRIFALNKGLIEAMCGRARVENQIPARLVRVTGKALYQLNEFLELLVRSVGDQSLFDISQDLLFRLWMSSKPLDKSKVFGELCLRPLQPPISTRASSAELLNTYGASSFNRAQELPYPTPALLPLHSGVIAPHVLRQNGQFSSQSSKMAVHPFGTNVGSHPGYSD